MRTAGVRQSAVSMTRFAPSKIGAAVPAKEPAERDVDLKLWPSAQAARV